MILSFRPMWNDRFYFSYSLDEQGAYQVLRRIYKSFRNLMGQNPYKKANITNPKNIF